MSVTYDVTVTDIGGNDVFTIDETSGYLQNLTITNTQTNNYQTGNITIKNHPSSSSVNLGAEVSISINETKVFDGTVNRIMTTMEGIRIDSFDLIGLTSLLWKSGWLYSID